MKIFMFMPIKKKKKKNEAVYIFELAPRATHREYVTCLNNLLLERIRKIAHSWLYVSEFFFRSSSKAPNGELNSLRLLIVLTTKKLAQICYFNNYLVCTLAG